MLPNTIGNLLQGKMSPFSRIVIVCIPTGHLPELPKLHHNGRVVLIDNPFSEQYCFIPLIISIVCLVSLGDNMSSTTAFPIGTILEKDNKRIFLFTNVSKNFDERGVVFFDKT